MLGAQLRERLDGIRRSRLAHLAIVDREARLAGDGDLDHPQSQRVARDRALAVRRIAGGHEAHLRQAEQLLFTARGRLAAIQREITQVENALSLLLGRQPGGIDRGVPDRPARSP